MRATHKILALVVAWQMAPGAAEFVENVVHLAFTGHSAHALDDEAHAADGEEHGCSGTFHLCKCCTSSTFVTTRARLATDRAAHRDPIAANPRDVAAEGFPHGVFKPPRV